MFILIEFGFLFYIVKVLISKLFLGGGGVVQLGMRGRVRVYEEVLVIMELELLNLYGGNSLGIFY